MDAHFMQRAIDLAWQSAEAGFDPFGCVLVAEGEIRYESPDRCIQYADPTAHAELVAIREHCQQTKQIDLRGYTLYCNVEPCLMCCGAIHWAKIERVVFALGQAQLQQKSGGTPKPSAENLLNLGGRKVTIESGLLAEEAIKVFERFPFRSKRERFEGYWGAD
ncbi:MAG: nucleoside deaminase [Bacteroidota bacterium]